VTHDELFEDALSAVRDAGDADPGDLAETTRARLVRSLEVRVRRHRQLVSFVTIMVVLLGGTVSWAWTTGRLQALWSSPPAPEPAPIPEPAPPAPAPRPPVVHAAIAPAPAPEEVTAPAPELEAPPLRSVAKPPPTPIEQLYRKAHELHFHGRDHIAALAAWDAYLAAEPTGRFAIEARFNRGIVLARLGRYADALAALEPFARGAVEPAGYRRDEAAQLVERLGRLVENPVNDR
jgi:hypothetical protein